MTTLVMANSQFCINRLSGSSTASGTDEMPYMDTA